MREIEKVAREWLDCYFYSPNNPVSAPYSKGREDIHKIPCECARLTTLLLSERDAARREAVEDAVKVVQNHLDRAATIRQAVAQPGMIPELSEERKREEHRIAAATIALRHPITKALRTLVPTANGTKEVPQ